MNSFTNRKMRLRNINKKIHAPNQHRKKMKIILDYLIMYRRNYRDSEFCIYCDKYIDDDKSKISLGAQYPTLYYCSVSCMECETTTNEPDYDEDYR